jgi:4'-phosphopantetheinyl transferase
MTSIFQNNLKINTFFPKPELVIWYVKISRIMQSILYKKSLPDSKLKKNRFFGKDDFSKSFLNHDELKILNGFKALKKQIEWISGRYLTKLMIQYNFYPVLPLDEINLSYLDEGAPFLNHDPGLPFSISHSNEYTATACCKKRTKIIGVDVEKITEKPNAGFLKTAFTKNEILHLEDNAVSIFKNWTIKEAYLKYIKKGFNENLYNVEVIDNKIWHNQTKINVDIYSTMINENYILSLVSN